MAFKTYAAAVCGMLTLGLAAALFSGCTTFKPGGSGHADDTYTYHSTAHEPKTVALVDTRTSETIWTYEVPVNRQLTIAFYEDEYPKNPDQPARMHWREYSIGMSQGNLTNTMAVPDRGNRRIDLFVRPHPEYPKTAGGAAAGR